MLGTSRHHGNTPARGNMWGVRPRNPYTPLRWDDAAVSTRSLRHAKPRASGKNQRLPRPLLRLALPSTSLSTWPLRPRRLCDARRVARVAL
eukprot:scaffold13863_cov35-Tisochrysis_lutea.AAC.8